MKTTFIRLHDPDRGQITAVVEAGEVFEISGLVGTDVLGLIQSHRLNDPSFLEEIRDGLTDKIRYPVDYEELLEQTPQDDGPYLMLPLDPAEVWGVGVSYQRAAELHEEDIRADGLMAGLYDYVFQSERPEIFFKGLARHSVGHNHFLGIRDDSHGTMVEAELGCIYDNDNTIVAYTIANDVTAWDIEKESPLFVSYAKIFTGSCALGPGVVPASLISDPKSLAVRCRIERQNKIIYEGEGNTSNMKRTFDELTRYLTHCNPIPDGTVLCTGTAVGIPNDLVIEEGDKVTISIEGIGELSNVAKRLQSKDKLGGAS